MFNHIQNVAIDWLKLDWFFGFKRTIYMASHESSESRESRNEERERVRERERVYKFQSKIIIIIHVQYSWIYNW